MLSGMHSPSQVSVKHRAEDPDKSLFIFFRSSSSSILLGRERTFGRYNAGSGVRNPRFRSLTSTPARFPRLRLLQAPQRAAAPPTKISKKVYGSVKSGSESPDSAVNHNTNQGGAGPHGIGRGDESRDGLLLRQKLKMDNKSKKRPGGTEKHREKKLKSLWVEAAKCAKLTDLFGAGFTSPAAAGAPGD
ncbi:unnamed protein product [Pleuronectes platessa]|uniref:Uncharacterized protein n=1 Tax=Pleuronectes platessa TaxID=8262 RepID=A0A9N7UP77_PLEPL|nr:unnamed protein product [Pleuronectes platessa]